MTLLVALNGRDGIVLAADSRGTFGDPRGITAQNDSQQKAHILSRRVAALQAGIGEVGALIVQHARERVTNEGIDGVTPVMNALRETARVNYNEWFPSVPPIPAPQLVMTGQAPSRPDLVFILAGYELQTEGENPVAVTRIYQLGSATDFAPMVHDYGFAVAGVAQYALYLLNRLYEPNRTVEELQALAVYAVTETASQDGKVGGPVKLVTRLTRLPKKMRGAPSRSETAFTGGGVMSDYDAVDMTQRLLYQVTLASGRIVTRPDDFGDGDVTALSEDYYRPTFSEDGRLLRPDRATESDAGPAPAEASTDSA